MEPRNEDSSAPPEIHPPSNCGEAPALKPQHTPRRGVEPRDAVLKQFREHPDIIMLDSDDDIADDAHMPIRNIHLPNQTSNAASTETQIIDRGNISNESADREAENPETRHKSGSKRKLFDSKEAQENMYRSSGLPSPPRTEGSSPQSSFGLSGSDTGRVSWSFETLNTCQDDHQSQNQGPDIGNADEWSVRMARLVNQDVTPDSTQRGCSAQPAPDSDAILNAKDAIEAKGISRSQQLRAERKTREMSRNLHSVAPSVSQASSTNTPPIVNIPYKIQKNRERQWEDRDELSADEIERQLDFAERLRKESGTSKKATTSSSRQRGTHHPRPDPFSQSAAERYRTQNRHLNYDDDDLAYEKTSPRSNDMPDIVDPEDQRRADERLMRIKMNALGRKPDSGPRARANRAAVPPVRFHAPFDGKPASKHNSSAQRPPKQTREAIRALMGTLQAPGTDDLPSNETRSLESDGNITAGPQTKLALPTFALLEQLSGLRAGAAGDGANADRAQDRYDTLLPQGEGLNLPSNYATLSPTRQALVKRRETLKERHKDFEVIIEVYKAFATLLAIEELREIDMKQLEEVKKFAAAVLDRDRSGKGARKRVRDINDNVKRRLQRLPSDTDADLVNEKLNDIMLPRYLEKMAREKPKTQAELILVQAECSTYHHKTGNMRPGKAKVKTGSGTLADGRSRSEKCRQAYYSSLDKQIEQHRAQLAQFNESDAPLAAAIDGGELEIIDPEDNESLVSEEDAIDASAKPLGSTNRAPQLHEEVSSIEETTRFKDQRPGESAQKAAVAQPTQAADQSLQQKMLARAQQIEHTGIQGVQRHDSQMLQNMREKEALRAEQARKLEAAVAAPDANECSLGVVEDDLFEVGSSHEFDDSDTDIEDEDETTEEGKDEDDQPVCRRYVVKSLVVGVSPKWDHDECVIGSFLSRKRAIKKVLEVAPRVQKAYLRRNPDSDVGPFSICLEEDGFEYEQQMKLGPNQDAGCRTWIEEETYNPSEEAYEYAKVYKACQPPKTWFVDWEKIVKPVRENEDDETEDVAEGGERGLTASSAEPAVTTPTDEPREHSMANTGDGSDSSIPTPGTPLSNQVEHQEHLDSSNRTTEEVTTAEPQSSTTEDDDLFGPDTAQSPFPSSPPTSISGTNEIPKRGSSQIITTRATGESFRIFHCLAHANRHAKRVFMHWFVTHLPGPVNHRYINGEEESMEEELKRIGNRACWAKQESVVRWTEDGVRVRESFRVWVARAKYSGPTN